MLLPPRNFAAELSFPIPAPAAVSEKSSEIECEVINLFDQYRNPLLRYVLSFGLSVHDAEEVTQDVFLALFCHLQRGKSRRNLRSWIFRVAHNLALKQRAANKRLQAALDDDSTIAQAKLDAAPNPEEQVTSGQTLRRLRTVLRALPEQDRCCLVLRAEGLRYREIAATLGISLGSVSLSLTRSLARLGIAGKSAEQGTRHGG
jgi:RNA polymerase sigma-70 factor, ECF subfamily